jgi:hypothetical protein
MVKNATSQESAVFLELEKFLRKLTADGYNMSKTEERELAEAIHEDTKAKPWYQSLFEIVGDVAPTVLSLLSLL